MYFNLVDIKLFSSDILLLEVIDNDVFEYYLFFWALSFFKCQLIMCLFTSLWKLAVGLRLAPIIY